MKAKLFLAIIVGLIGFSSVTNAQDTVSMNAVTMLDEQELNREQPSNWERHHRERRHRERGGWERRHRERGGWERHHRERGGWERRGGWGWRN